MDIRTFDRYLDTAEALEHTRNLSAKRYLRSVIAERFGIGGIETDPDVYIVYYPDYILYTSVVYTRLRNTESRKFLAGVDAVSGSIGEVDVELPERHTQDVDPSVRIEPQLTEAEARDEWNVWIFDYVSRNYRALKINEYEIDELELVYTPYWIIDNGTIEDSLAISDLTRRTAKVEEIQVIKEFYEDHLSENPPAPLVE